MDDGHGLWVVADGMGGHHGGEIASAIACEEIPEQISSGADIEAALRAAHQKIVARGAVQPELKGMGTTVVVVHEQGTEYEIAWSGDSRIYRWRRGRLTQRSEDHSIVQRMLKSGLLSEQQAKNHPHQHVISSCLGSTSADGLEIGYQRDVWEKDDWLLLCSDGLTDELEDDQIAAILARNSTVEEAGKALLQAALDSGGRDNVTVALIRAPEGAPAGLVTRNPFFPLLLAIAGVALVIVILLAMNLMEQGA
jgi:protein phosphatase